MISDNLKGIIVQALIVLGTFTGSYLVFAKDSKEIDNVTNQTVVNNLQNQINRLEEQQVKHQEKIDALTTLYTDCGAVNTSLRIENEKLKLERSYEYNSTNQKPYAEWTKNTDFILLDVNDKCVEIFFKPYGLKRKDIIGYDDYKNFSKEDADKFRETDQKVLETKRPLTYFQDITIKGEVLKFYVIRYPVFKNGRVHQLKGACFKV